MLKISGVSMHLNSIEITGYLKKFDTPTLSRDFHFFIQMKFGWDNLDGPLIWKRKLDGTLAESVMIAFFNRQSTLLEAGARRLLSNGH